MAESLELYHLDSERSLRGGERQLLYLAAHLRRRGHRNIVVCRRGFPLHREAERLGFETLHLPFWGEWDPVSAWLLSRATQGAKRPVLHAHTAHAAALACLASRFSRLPWVAHRRVDFRIHGALKYRRAAAVIAVSDYVRKTLLEGGVARVQVVPDCIPVTDEEASAAGCALLRPPTAPDREEARRSLSREFGLPLDRPWVGNLAALVPHKDQATLLRAAARVPDARFAFVGGGPLLDDLKGLARSLGILDRVAFAGFQRDPSRWLRGLDLYVQSSWGEGMGSVLLEAMACAVPIAATDAGGIPEVVRHGETALLAPARDPEGLARVISESLQDRAGADRRARAARKALESFSLTRLGDRVLAVYEGLA
ncbi:MAG: glycosyltransferase [Elusimicrobiota bacterium]